MGNICEKDYAAFLEGALQSMMHMPVSGICIITKMQDGSVSSDYYNSRVMDKMVYAGVIQQDVTLDILKANNMIRKSDEE